MISKRTCRGTTFIQSRTRHCVSVCLLARYRTWNCHLTEDQWLSNRIGRRFRCRRAWGEREKDRVYSASEMRASKFLFYSPISMADWIGSDLTEGIGRSLCLSAISSVLRERPLTCWVRVCGEDIYIMKMKRPCTVNGRWGWRAEGGVGQDRGIQRYVARLWLIN